MLNYVKEVGYAKINLHLDVLCRLEGGYHGVETVMQSISLCDEIEICDLKMSDTPFFYAECNKKGVPTDEKNIAVRAALAFCNATGVSLCGKIVIKKNIPMAAGMAGGSTDGAAVLRGLNRALDCPLSEGELCRIGAVLGADVPFCIVGGTKYADGRGDVLHDFPTMPDCVIVVACEGEGVSTPWGYGLLDKTFENFDENCGYIPRGTEGLQAALRAKSLKDTVTSLYNIFEAPVLAHRPVAADVKKTLEEGGAMGAMMSGSGPSVFGIFDDFTTAQTAAEALKKKGYTPYICKPINEC